MKGSAKASPSIHKAKACSFSFEGVFFYVVCVMIDESVINLTFGRRAEMRLFIKQRVFSCTDSYDVYDEGGGGKIFCEG